MRTHTKLYFYLIALLLTACAETPKEMVFFPNHELDLQAKVWPAPPEVPRYRYAGQLLGEQNFIPDLKADSGSGNNFINWLVGIGGRNTETRQLLRPQTGLVDHDGRIYVTDVGKSAIFVFDKKNLRIWNQADSNDHFLSPIGISNGPAGQILVADSQLARVVRLDKNGNPLGSVGRGILQRPTGLAFDSASEHIFVADTAAHDIKIFNKSGKLIKSIGHRGTASGEFNGPTHLAIAGDKLYVSDTLNARIQIFTTDGRFLGVVGKRGLFIGNFTRPKGVTVDDDANVYVIESYYDHLLIFDPRGKLLLPIGGNGRSVGKFHLPAGIWHDDKNRIYIADMFNSRVIILQYLGL